MLSVTGVWIRETSPTVDCLPPMSTVPAVKIEKKGQEEVPVYYSHTAAASMHPGHKKVGELFSVEYLLPTIHKKKKKTLKTQLSDTRKW